MCIELRKGSFAILVEHVISLAYLAVHYVDQTYKTWIRLTHCLEVTLSLIITDAFDWLAV